jgi:hypothetical protein
MYFSENEFSNPLYPLLIPPLVRGTQRGQRGGWWDYLIFIKSFASKKIMRV